MNELKKEILAIKKKLTIKVQKEAAVKRQLLLILGDIFKDRPSWPRHLKTSYLTGRKLVIEAKTKTFANEIFLAKELILSRLTPKTEVRDLVVR